MEGMQPFVWRATLEQSSLLIVDAGRPYRKMDEVQDHRR